MQLVNSEDHPLLEVSTNKGLKLVSIHDIHFIKASNKGSIIYMNDSENFLTKHSLDLYIKQLPLPYFFRCHRKFIVNCKFVDCFSFCQLILKDNIRIPIARTKKKQFKENLIVFQQLS